MPRRYGTIAIDQARKAHAARWRYLLRNPAFRADINALLLARRSESLSTNDGRDAATRAIRAERTLHEKWGLDAIPASLRLGYHTHPNAKVLPELTGQTVKVWEEVFSVDLFPPFYGLASVGWGESGEDDSWIALRRGLLNLTVDITYPLDLLMAAIEAELREKIEFRRSLVKESPKPYRRLRVDNIDFQLNVFDRAERGETFSVIAKALDAKGSTVKTAFLVARARIRADSQSPKLDLILDDFDPATHMTKCRVCAAAETLEAMCPAAQRHVTQDHRSASPKEILGYTDEDRARPRSETSRHRRRS